MKAQLTNYRQAPRKVRLVADLIKGKSVKDAKSELAFLVKRASLPIAKLLDSAVANAKVSGADVETLFIKEVRVDKGTVLKRFMPRAFGRASQINKRNSHVVIVLGVRGEDTKKKGSKKTVTEKVEKTETPEKKIVAKKTTKKVTKK